MTPDIKTDPSHRSPHALLKELQKLRYCVVADGNQIFDRWQPTIERAQFRDSLRNLAYYLALRHHDLRPLQVALMPLGLSSLGRSESRVLANLDAVIATLGALCHQDPSHCPPHPPLETFFAGEQLLQAHTEEVFGATSPRRRVRIMVTVPTEAAHHYRWLKDLVERGIDCIRLNCAHDGPEEWKSTIQHLRRAEAETGRHCKILMDLAGPKVRLQRVLPPASQSRIYLGDCLLLTPQAPTLPHPTHFQASCSHPQVLSRLQIGDSIWIDDGKVGAVVESSPEGGVLLRITHARPKGEKLKAEKGINFPDTYLNLDPLTDKDRQDLDFVAAHADLIGYSFVQHGADIEMLQLELQSRLGDRWRRIALIAKIETPTAVKNLPDLIVHGAGKQPFGVMIARGDLAVELGYQRLAEMQEEILWLCQAAHVPVIWATQVLENLVKNSLPSRAEMTDAAMAQRAECVMLNKGAFVGEAVSTLDDVLQRMHAHQLKKTPQLRALQAW